MNIILFGFKKCGKVYYGLKASEELRMNFVNSNLVAEKVYTQMYHQELSYREIVKKHGFSFFCKIEKRAISLMARERNSILSLGGSLALEKENIERLQEIGPMIYIKTPKNILKSRLLSHEVPGFLDPANPSESFEALYKKRTSLYEAVKAYVIDTEGKSEDEVTKELLDLIKKLKKKGIH